MTWFKNGKIRSIANYYKGKLHGKKQIWIQDSIYTLVAEYNNHLGKGHGKQTKWYATGELFQIRNLQMGIEEGMQQAFRKNGDLYANYEAKNGRIFGLKKASLCFGLEDSVLPKSLSNSQFYSMSIYFIHLISCLHSPFLLASKIILL